MQRRKEDSVRRALLADKRSERMAADLSLNTAAPIIVGQFSTRPCDLALKIFQNGKATQDPTQK
jgi:hypothetical protein